MLEIAVMHLGIKQYSAVDTAWRRLVGLFAQFGCHISEIGRAQGGSYGEQLRALRSARYVLCATVWHVLFARLLVFGSEGRIIYWVQGLLPEESYMRHQSKLRWILLRVIEYLSFRCAFAIVYVSPGMQSFYERRYRFAAMKEAVNVPCTSDLVMSKASVRKANAYCYLGGMATWQRFDIVVQLMNVVLRHTPNAHFSVATPDVDLCKSILCKHASMDLLERTRVVRLDSKGAVAEFLSAQEFGFLIRDDNPVNNVASPIKLAEYMSCGVCVIGTAGVSSYADVIRVAGYLIQSDSAISEGAIPRFEYLGAEKIIAEYNRRFSNDAIRASFVDFLSRLRIGAGVRRTEATST